VRLRVIDRSEVELLQGILEELTEGESYRIVVVKPNICGFYPPSVEVLRVVLKWASRKGGEVYLGDTPSTIHSVEERIEELKLREVAREAGTNVHAVNFLRVTGSVKVEVPKPHALKRYPFPELVLNADLLINLAKLGSHPTTRVTGALKNLFGLVSSKMKYFRYHLLGIDRVIADIAQVIRPRVNVLEVEDRIVVSDDPLVADVAGVLIYGDDPLKVKHFRLVAEDRNMELEDLVSEARKILR